MRTPVLLAALIAPLLFPAAALAAEVPTTTYMVSMKLHDGATLVGTPALRVAAGEVATVEIGDEAGHRYSVRVTVTPSDDGTLFVQSAIDVVTREGEYSAEPAMTVQPGLPAGILVGMVRDTSQPFRVDLIVDSLPAR